MAIEKQQIVNAFYKIIDPDTGRDMIKSRMVDNLVIDGNNVNFDLVLNDINHPRKDDFAFQCEVAVRNLYPEAEVNVHVVVKTKKSKQTTSPAPQIRNIIAVGSGKGGVGKSTVAVNIALALRKLGAKVGLMDADLYGPSIPTMLGLKGERPKVHDKDGVSKIIPLEAYDMPTISIGYIIDPEQAVVLRGPRLAAIIKQFFNDVRWPDLDFLVVDLPPGTGDIQLTLVQTVPVTGAIMVTTPQEVAVIDAVKAMNMFLLPTVDVPILGVVENMSWFTPEDLPDRKYFLFGEGGGKKLAKIGNSVLLGQVPLVVGIREGGDTGKPAVMNPSSPVAEAFIHIAENVIKQVTFRNETLAPTKIVQLTR